MKSSSCACGLWHHWPSSTAAAAALRFAVQSLRAVLFVLRRFLMKLHESAVCRTLCNKFVLRPLIVSVLARLQQQQQQHPVE